jgi:hypothetical protein
MLAVVRPPHDRRLVTAMLEARAMVGVKQTRAVLERFSEQTVSLTDWSAVFAKVTAPAAATRGLRFVFYWHYSDADRQDPATSRVWQLPRWTCSASSPTAKLRSNAPAPSAR